MSFLMKGILVEYGSDFLGPIPNIVFFQFNPESLKRNIQIPPRPAASGSRESAQAGDVPMEKISLTAHFSAADRLGDDRIIPRIFGIGPQLAALEKMVYPEGIISSGISFVVDAVADAIGGGDEPAEAPIPRRKYPRILFIWGLTRVLPVVIESMQITEQKYDTILNPVQAEVALTLSVMSDDSCSIDAVGSGSLTYSNLMKEVQAILNLESTIETVAEMGTEIISF